MSMFFFPPAVRSMHSELEKQEARQTHNHSQSDFARRNRLSSILRSAFSLCIFQSRIKIIYPICNLVFIVNIILWDEILF